VGSDSGASPLRPAAESLGWLPPRLLRVPLAAGPLLLALVTPPALAQADGPIARYTSTVLKAAPGDAFEVTLEVTWQGPADRFDIAPPRPVEKEGIRYSLNASESGQEGEQSFVRFTWLVSVDATGAYAFPELLPVVAHRPDAPAPVPVEIERPLTIEVAAPLSLPQRLGLAAGGLGLTGAAVGGAMLLRRRRSALTRARQTQHARAKHAAELRERFQTARKHRVEGNLGAYMDALRTIAGACESGTPALEELATLHERIAYAHYEASGPELDRAESLVRRQLDALTT